MGVRFADDLHLTPLELSEPSVREATVSAVRAFWRTRESAGSKSEDRGTRSEVTSGKALDGFASVLFRTLLGSNVSRASIFFGARTEIPGFYRPEKEWDLLVVIDGVLRVAIELKSQVGPSFGNNANNRIEEALGSAIDARRASSAGLLGAANGQPWLGYLFLLEDATGSRRKVRPAESHFPVDPIFKSSSYVERYAALCRRLEREGVYSATCLLLSPRAKTGAYSEPAPDLGIVRFLRSLRDHSLGHGVTSRLSSRQNQLQ